MYMHTSICMYLHKSVTAICMGVLEENCYLRVYYYCIKDVNNQSLLS